MSGMYTTILTVCECTGCEQQFFLPDGIEKYNKEMKPTVDGVICPYGCKDTEIDYVGETKAI